MFITITGVPGSGKTTVAKRLSKECGIPWYSMGDLRGKMAEDRGLTIDQLNKLGETESFTDTEIDAYQKKLGEAGKDCIVEGRLSWYFIPHSFKLFLDVEPAKGGERVYRARLANHRSDEPLYTSAEEAAQFAKERIASDVKRYQKYYGVDFLNHANYDAVIDTSDMTVDQMMEKIMIELSNQNSKK